MNYTELFTIHWSLLQQNSLGYKLHPTFRATKSFVGPGAKGMGWSEQLCSFLTSGSEILHYILCSSFCYQALQFFSPVTKFFRLSSCFSGLARTGGLYRN